MSFLQDFSHRAILTSSKVIPLPPPKKVNLIHRTPITTKRTPAFTSTDNTGINDLSLFTGQPPRGPFPGFDWSTVDGLRNAPAGTPQFPALLNASNGYVTRPPWHVSGVDYYVGCPQNITLKDPATISMAGVSITGQQLTVSGNNITLDSYDFSLEGGWFVHVTGNNCNITNNLFKVGTNATSFLFIDNTAINTIIRYNTFDGNTGASVPGAAVVISGIGTTFFEYNYVHDVWAEGIQCGINQISSANFFFRYNVVANVGYSNGSPHADWLQFWSPGTGAGSVNGITINYNLWLQNHAIATGPQGLSLQSANVPQYPVLAESVSNNTFITSGTNTIGQAAVINPTNLNGNCVFQNNYLDYRGMAFEALQFFDNDVGGGGSGAFNGTLNGYASQVAWNSAGNPGGNIILMDGSVWGTQ